MKNNKFNFQIELQYKYEILAALLHRIKEKGIFFCIRRGFKKLLYDVIFCQIAGFIAWPFCSLFNVKFISPLECGIGHLCVEPDCYIKEGMLCLRPQFKIIMLVPKNKIYNRHLLTYWEKYIKIITSPLFCLLFDPLQKNKFTLAQTHRFVFSPNSAYFPQIQKKFSDRPALLILRDEDLKRGWAVLYDLGMKKDDWFVCVHCREDGCSGRIEPTRNADIHNYFPAMDDIVQRGGWVIRMGDKSMKQIPSMKGVIDYPHLGIKSEWMDVFLCAASKFFLGSHSGLCHVANIFGVPVAIANSAHMAGVLPYGAKDIAIPKLTWSDKENRYLHFKEVFDSALSHSCLSQLYESSQLRLVENSPEDIKKLAEEMFDRIEGKLNYAQVDEELQQRFKSLMNPSHFSYGSVSRIGRDFLHKYSNLIL
ncbi:MAG: TIGR04372 family glycosyltransferase [Candidatus Omnitrophica bacterium]|nr:TIGR04372 family glycosyltransferase [Candidatus Omnitrophota bacterium]